MLQVDATGCFNTLMLNKVPQSAAAESFCTEGIGFVVTICDLKLLSCPTVG